MPIRLVKLIALSLLAMLVFAACSPAPIQPEPTQPAGTNTPPSPATPVPTSPPGTSTPEPAPTDGPLAPAAKDRFAAVDPKGQKIVYWHAQTGKNQAALEKIVKDFNTSNSWGISIEAVGQGSEEGIFQKMQPVMNTPDQPGLMEASQNNAAFYQLSGALEDLNGLVISAKWGLTTREFNDFSGPVMAQDIYTVFLGARLGFPVSRSMGLLYANQDWLKELGFDKMPQSPQEFKTAACKATNQAYSKRSGTDGPSIGLVIPKDASFMISLIYAFGGDLFGTANNFYTLGSDPALNAAVFLQDLVKEGCVKVNSDPEAARKLFGGGQVLFLPASTDDLALVSAASAEGAKFTWMVGPLPHNGPDPVLTVTGASLSIPKSTPEKELAAWLFIRYLTGAAVQAEWASASGFLPVREAAGGALEGYFAQNPVYKTAFDLMKYAKPEPPVPGSDQVRQKMALALGTLTSPPYPEAQTVLGQLNQDSNQVLQDLLAQKK